MSRPLITFLVFNSFTTFIVSYLYNYYMSFHREEIVSQNSKLEFVLNKIHDLEKSIVELQYSIDNIEESIEKKNNRVIESNIVLNSKLEEFIHSNYELYNDNYE